MGYAHPKHMSTMTSTGVYVPPALPGYIPQHDPSMSPPLLHTFPPGDGMTPMQAASDTTNPGSPGPSHTSFAAPAYQQVQTQQM
jgi:hypothetical protein